MDENEVGKVEEEGTRDLKRKEKHEAPHVPIDVSSKEEKEGTKLLDPSSAEVTREVRENSILIKASLLDVVKLLGVNMGFRSYSNNSKAFTDFVKFVSAKLNLSEVCST